LSIESVAPSTLNTISPTTPSTPQVDPSREAKHLTHEWGYKMGVDQTQKAKAADPGKGKKTMRLPISPVNPFDVYKSDESLIITGYSYNSVVVDRLTGKILMVISTSKSIKTKSVFSFVYKFDTQTFPGPEILQTNLNKVGFWFKDKTYIPPIT
jgi:hypothetical protein